MKAAGGALTGVGGASGGGGVTGAGGTIGAGGLVRSAKAGRTGGVLVDTAGGTGAKVSGWLSEADRSSVNVGGCEAMGASGAGTFGSGVGGAMGFSATGYAGGIGAGEGAGTSTGSLNTSRCFSASNSVGVRAPASSISLSWRSVSRGEDGLFMTPEYGLRGG